MSTNTSTQTQPDWEEIILKLTAFTHSWVKGKSWFRGKKTTTFLMGKEIEDYVFQAIGKFIENPEKFNSEKGELIEYLKYNLVRSFIANDVRRTENKLTDDIFDDGLNDNDDETSTYAEKIMPFTEALFPDDIDYDSIKKFIEAQIQGDKDVENIFLATYTYDMKRREVIEEFAMSPSEYDNGMRRLKTILTLTNLHFTKNKQMV